MTGSPAVPSDDRKQTSTGDGAASVNEAHDVETAPVETAPVETAPVETAPVETAPVETAPVESAAVEAPAVESPPAPPGDPTATRIDAVAKSIAGFEGRLEQHLADTASYSREAFDRLYTEMRQYKDGFLTEAKRDLITDVMLLFDGVERLAKHYQNAEGPISSSELASNLDGLAVEAEEVLERQGLVRTVCEPGKLDRQLQRAVQTEPTAEPDEDRVVVRKVRSGFLLGERPFRKEEVVVKKYREPPAPEAGDAERGPDNPEPDAAGSTS